MKILHVTPDIYEGGVATLIDEMCKYQVAEGNDVTVLCAVNSDNQLSRKEYFENGGIKVIYSPYENLYDPRLILYFKKIFAGFDIVHVHLFPNQLYARIAVMLMPASKRPVVITTEHSTYNNRRKYSLLKILDKWMYKGYDKIVCISKQTERNLREWLDQINLGNRIVTICNGVNLSKFIPINSEEERPKNVVMVARLEHPKDPLTVVRAISKCPSDVNLYFVGSGYMDSSVKELSKELNIEDRVHLLGNRKDVPEILHNSGIGVLSTEWEGFGLVLVEYMATGLPILMSEVDGIQDVVGDRDSLFVNGDDDELAGKITRLIEDKDFYTAKSRFFKDRSSEFSIERMNKTYIDLYRNLLS